MSKLDKAIRNLLKIAQDEHGEHYEEKSRHDKITCIICSGKYTRQCKKTHMRTNMHTSRENKLFEDIKREILYNIPAYPKGAACPSRDKAKKKTTFDMEEIEELNNSFPKFDLDKAMKELEEFEQLHKKKESKRDILEKLLEEIENVDATEEYTLSDLTDISDSEDDLTFRLEPESKPLSRIEVILQAPPLENRTTLSDSYIKIN